jgi:hypothetical protein
LRVDITPGAHVLHPLVVGPLQGLLVLRSVLESNVRPEETGRGLGRSVRQRDEALEEDCPWSGLLQRGDKWATGRSRNVDRCGRAARARLRRYGPEPGLRCTLEDKAGKPALRISAGCDGGE